MNSAEIARKKFLQLAREHPLAVTFIVIAILVRLAFWLYTGRVWEDALIALAPARNAWLGNGLTHHLGEARVQSFTSPVGEIIPLIGESIHQGLFLARLMALIAAGLAIYYAYRIGNIFKFSWAAQVFLLSYLATDQLQIIFGMTGMETQIATTIFLATLYYLLEEKWERLAVVAGLGMLVRPEFIFCIATIGLFMLLKHPRKLPKVITIFLCVIAPWCLFAIFYYGSIIPNTIMAKRIYNPSDSLDELLLQAGTYFMKSWENIAPFKEWDSEDKVPLPMFFIQATVSMVLLLAYYGTVGAIVKREWRLLTAAGAVLLFFSYRSLLQLNAYFMWYLPPFLAYLFIIAAYGISGIKRKYDKIAAGICIFLALMYAIHIPFSFVGEKEVQQQIDCGVRFKTGVTLNSLMGPTDTAVLEPLGYIGYGAFNKTIYDYPGLSSRHVVDVMRHMKNTDIVDLIDELQPSFVALRPSEAENLHDKHPGTATNYTLVADIKMAEGVTLEHWGYSLAGELYDREYLILRRKAPQTEFGKRFAPSEFQADDIYGICKDIP